MLAKLLYETTKFNSRSVRIRGRTFRLWIADSLSRGAVGLMYREGMRADQGMLYIFPFERAWKIWMLNMRFPLDVVWLNKTGVVVHIEKNLKPCKSLFSCRTYAPKRGAKYVLELNAGSASGLGIRLGDELASVRARRLGAR